MNECLQAISTTGSLQLNVCLCNVEKNSKKTNTSDYDPDHDVNYGHMPGYLIF